jgi:tetratricopeptide (TPR) repeat protein
MRGDYTTALKGFEETLKEAETLKDNALIFGAASNLGGIYLRMNRPEDALRYFERAEKVSEHLNDPSARPNSAYNLACAYISLKRFDDALNWIRIAESRATTGEQKARFALTLCELFIESERPLPHEEMEHAFELCHTSRDHILLSWAHRIASKRFRKAGDIERALTHAEESIAISREVHSMLNLGLAYLEAARTLKIMGKEEDARRNASLALGAFIQEKADMLISELRSEFPDIEPVTPQG